MRIDLNQIKDWREFEHLVAHFFEEESKNNQNNIQSVTVKLTGVGEDTGCDLLVTFRFKNSMLEFEQKWVVQCRFYDTTISVSHLSDVNIPTLIHQYGANGYLLICKNDVSPKLIKMFKGLEENCRLNYYYKVWSGHEFASKISDRPSIVNFYFSKNT